MPIPPAQPVLVELEEPESGGSPVLLVRDAWYFRSAQAKPIVP